MRADSSWRCKSVADDMVGVGYEDSSVFTDQVGRTGMPQESVS